MICRIFSIAKLTNNGTLKNNYFVFYYQYKKKLSIHKTKNFPFQRSFQLLEFGNFLIEILKTIHHQNPHKSCLMLDEPDNLGLSHRQFLYRQG